MNDLANEYWDHFADETREHLESIGEILKQDGVDYSDDTIEILHRRMHSIKGLAVAMDLMVMGELSEICESILAYVHKGSVDFSEEIKSTVSESHSFLLELRRSAVETRRDESEVPYGIMEKLNVLLQSVSEIAASNADDNGAATDDGSDLMRYFASISKQNLPIIAGVMSDCFNGSDDDVANVSNAVETLTQAAEGMEYSPMLDLLGNVKSALPDFINEASAREKMFAALEELKLLIDHVEKQSGAEAGGAELAEALNDMAVKKLDPVFSEILMYVGKASSFAELGSAEVERIGNSVSRLAEVIYKLMKSTATPVSSSNMLMLEDLYNRIGRGEVPLNQEMVNMATLAVELERKIAHNDATQEDADDMSVKISDCVNSILHREQGSETSAQNELLLSAVKIKPEIMEVIAPENMRDLLDALSEGWFAYEIMTHLNGSEEVADAFMIWAQSRAKVITNRTILRGNDSWFEFLVVSEDPPEITQKYIEKMNPAGDLLQLSQCGGG